MKKIQAATLILFSAAIAVTAICDYEKAQRSAWKRIKNPETVQMLKTFVAAKKAQVYAATNEVPPEIKTMFKYAERGDWLALSNSVRKLRERIGYWDSLEYGMRRPNDYSGAIEDLILDLSKKTASPLPLDYWAPPRLQGTAGEAVNEVYGAFDAFLTGNEKYSTKFGREIVDSIPQGGLYFGGTDPGRFIVTAICKSQPNGDPCFVLSPGLLRGLSCAEPYLEYARRMYGTAIYLPTDGDLQQCYENWRGNSDMAMLSAPLIKMIFDKNPGRELFIEQSYPIKWMRPNLEPHGLIFKLNRQPVEKLSDEILRHDHHFWTNEIQAMLGDWLHDETSIKEIAVFSQITFGRRDLRGFSGDTNFINNSYTQSMFSGSRSAIADLYDWRSQHTSDPAEKNRMANEADFAFRQAWALCPYSPEAVYRYVSFLLAQNRCDDAVFVVQTAIRLPQGKSDGAMMDLLNNVKQWKIEHPSGATGSDPTKL